MHRASSDKGQSSESGLLNNTVLAEALTNAFATLYSIRTSKNISLNDFEKAQRICQTWKEYFLEKDSKDSTRDFVLFNVLAQLFQKVEGHFLTKWKKQISDKLRPARLVTFKCWISDIVSDDQEKSQLTIKKMNEVLDKEFDDFLEEDKEHYFNGVLLMLEKLLEEKKTSSSLKGVLLLNTTIFRYHRSLLDEDLMSVAGVYLKNINNLVKTSISRTLTDLERSSWNCYHKAFFESFAQYCTLFDTILKTEDNEFYFRLNTTYDVFFNIFELLKVLKIADESKIKILHHSFDEFLNRYSSSLFSSFQSDEEGINSKLPDSIFSLAVLANLELKQHKEWLISMVSPSVEPSKTLIAQFHMVNANLKKAASWADFVRNFNLSASLLVLAMTDPKSNEKLITACQEHILAWKKFFTSSRLAFSM